MPVLDTDRDREEHLRLLRPSVRRAGGFVVTLLSTPRGVDADTAYDILRTAFLARFDQLLAPLLGAAVAARVYDADWLSPSPLPANQRRLSSMTVPAELRAEREAWIARYLVVRGRTVEIALDRKGLRADREFWWWLAKSHANVALRVRANAVDWPAWWRAIGKPTHLAHPERGVSGWALRFATPDARAREEVGIVLDRAGGIEALIRAPGPQAAALFTEAVRHAASATE